MASLLSDFMAGLQEENSSPTSVAVAVMSDNARTTKHVAIANMVHTKSTLPSRWETESEKGQPYSPQCPSRKSFVDCFAPTAPF
jgi:hypothetical protein